MTDPKLRRAWLKAARKVVKRRPLPWLHTLSCDRPKSTKPKE